MKIKIDSIGGGVTITSSPVGVATNSQKKDFYVYEWFIIDTGEIFYVGKGRGNRFENYHDNAYVAEKIRQTFNTGNRFIKTELTENEAIELENERMCYVLNETEYRLTNRMIPLFCKKGNGYDRAPNTPKLQYEKAPVLYANEIDNHYFKKTFRSFDVVEENGLNAVMIRYANVRDEVDVIYGGLLEKYIEETKELLELKGSKILKSEFAKSITAWIYVGDEDVSRYEKKQEKAMSDLGRKIPTYHLLDVLNFLKNGL